MRVLVAHRLATAVSARVFKAAVPDRIPACYYGAIIQSRGPAAPPGRRARSGISMLKLADGVANPEEDGASGLAAGLHNIQNTPVEIDRGALSDQVSPLMA